MSEIRIEKFCEHIGDNVRIKINVAAIETLTGDVFTNTSPHLNVCSENKKCNIRDCNVINEEVKKERLRLTESIKKTREENEKWKF